jgi:hypothetical protein
VLARYESPALGRFTSPDPLAQSANPAAPQTWNRYTYAAGNPVNFYDPTGLFLEAPSVLWTFVFSDFITVTAIADRAPSLDRSLVDRLADSAFFEWLASNTGPRFDVGLQRTGNFFAGFAHVVSFGLTDRVRAAQGLDHTVDEESDAYFAGEVTGYVHGALTAVAGSLNAGARTVVYSGEANGIKAYEMVEGVGSAIGKPLFKTVGGKVLNAVDGALKSVKPGSGLPAKVWDVASSIYVRNAKGVVNTVLRNPSPTSVYTRIEAPIIQSRGLATRAF